MEPLEGWIRGQIGAGGPVIFEQFMDWALYHPEHGYYASGRAALGRDEGDFTTAPQISELFGTCLARLISAADRALGSPARFSLVEGGAGEGRLGRQILDALQLRDPNLYGRLTYSPEESGEAWRARQEELLAPHRARVANAQARDFVGLYLSNELVDAFPVHRLVRRNDTLWEVYVGLEADNLTELLLPPSRPELAQLLEEEGVHVEEGCEVEVNLRALEWLRSVAGRLRRGYVVTVDYGDEAESLYGRRRAGGTCLAYERHRTSEELLARPGLRDLTAHVDFTALRRAGLSAGLEAAPLRTQRDFLFGLGFLREVEELEHRGLSEAELLAARRALAPLLFPGMGEAFHVLVQAKDAPLSALPLDSKRAVKG
ncbi:MAG: SAM-dependent methyltransferase [Deltaproteobacteria bacterium]|nr:SAM-dependent methyltransferase [Deltaproteobacteria bacterium]